MVSYRHVVMLFRLLGADHSFSPSRCFSLSLTHISPPPLVLMVMAFSCTSTLRQAILVDFIPVSDVPQTMVFSAVVTVSLFNGLNTNVWTGWVFFAILLGIVLLLVYTVLLLLCSLHFKGSLLPCSSYIMLSAQAGL